MREDGLEAGAAVAAQVEYGALGPDLTADVQGPGEGVNGALQVGGVAGGQIDQVDPVDEDGLHLGLDRLLLESLRLLWRVLLLAPGLGRRTEDLDGLGTHSLRPLNRLLQPALCGHVRSDSHRSSPKSVGHRLTQHYRALLSLRAIVLDHVYCIPVGGAGRRRLPSGALGNV